MAETDGNAVVPSARGVAVTVLMMGLAILVVGQLYAYLPFLPEIARRLGTSQETASLATTVFALSQAAGFLVVGMLNRKLATRSLLILGLLSLALASLITGYALSAGNTPGFLVGRGLQGLSAACFPPLALAAIIEANTPKNRPTALAFFSAALLMSAPLGQLLAGVIAAQSSVSGILLATSAMLLLFTLLISRVPFGTAPTATGTRLSGELAGLLHWRKLGRAYAATFVFLMGVVFYYAAVQSARAELDLQLFRLLGSPAVLMTLLSGVLLYRWSSPTVQALGFSLAAFGAVLTGYTGMSGLHIGHWLLLGGVALAVPALLNFIGQQSAKLRPTAILLYTFILFLGAGLGAPLASMLAEYALDSSMLLLATVYAMAALAVASYRIWPVAESN